jgi:hypothetical protein
MRHHATIQNNLNRSNTANKHLSRLFMEILNMVTLSDDEVALIRSILTALRSIKVRDIDKALVILSKGDKREKP